MLTQPHPSVPWKNNSFALSQVHPYRRRRVRVLMLLEPLRTPADLAAEGIRDGI